MLLKRKEVAKPQFKEKLGASESDGGFNLCQRVYDHCLNDNEVVKGPNITETRKLCFALMLSLADGCNSNAEIIASLLKSRHQFKDDDHTSVKSKKSAAIICEDPGGAYSNRYDRNGPKAPC